MLQCFCKIDGGFMRLKKILQDVDVVSVQNFKNYNISSVSHISQDVISGGMFICIKGDTFDGRDYLQNVISKGCKCIVSQEEFFVSGVCVVVVADIRKAMSVIAKNFYNRCVDGLTLIGVIGTSGKTSVTHIVRQLLSYNGDKIGVIGTNGIYIDNICMENKFTTPDPLELHYVFYQMKMLGVNTVVMEVSAQAIHFQKVFGIKFNVCVFTNISEEHLDFFGSYENYAKTKLDFFNSSNTRECVVNTDDFFGRELAFKVDIPCISYGVDEPANVFAIDIQISLDRTKFVGNIKDDIVQVDVPLVGKYSVYNILSAMAVCRLLGMSIQDISSAIKSIKPIDGRFEMFKKGNNLIVIDFAHTPQSIEKLLEHIKSNSNLDIVSLFGCVGYSDKDKRIAMAKSISKYSNRTYVTTDNIGNANFSDVVRDVASGLNIPYFVIEDRETAIRDAFEGLQEDEILVLIGKGSENFQKIGNERLPYSEREIVLKLLERKDK